MTSKGSRSSEDGPIASVAPEIRLGPRRTALNHALHIILLVDEHSTSKADRLAEAVAVAWPTRQAPTLQVATHRALDAPLIDHADALVVDLSDRLPPGESVLGLLVLHEMGLPVVLLGDATEFDRLYPDHGMLKLDRSPDTHALAGTLLGITHRQDEVADLLQESGRSKQQVDRLDRQLDRLHLELDGASRLQQQSLPDPTQRIEGGAIATLWKPAGPVSGDLVNVFDLGHGCTGLLVADSIGHGVPAAMLSMMLQRTITETRQFGDEAILRSPAKMLGRLNDSLLQNTGEETRFATAIYAVFDARSNHILLGAAGHPAPIVSRRTGTIERLEAHGPLLGIFSGERFAETGHRLDAGDRVVLYTDGIEQASLYAQHDRAVAGGDAVQQVVRAVADADTPETFITGIQTALDLDASRRSSDEMDDLTMLCLDVDAAAATGRRAA